MWKRFKKTPKLSSMLNWLPGCELVWQAGPGPWAPAPLWTGSPWAPWSCSWAPPRYSWTRAGLACTNKPGLIPVEVHEPATANHWATPHYLSSITYFCAAVLCTYFLIQVRLYWMLSNFISAFKTVFSRAGVHVLQFTNNIGVLIPILERKLKHF